MRWASLAAARGYAPDLAGGAFSALAPQTFQLDLWEPLRIEEVREEGKGEEENERKGREQGKKSGEGSNALQFCQLESSESYLFYRPTK